MSAQAPEMASPARSARPFSIRRSLAPLRTGSARGREIELILLTMFAAVPLYGTAVISIVPLAIFHIVMAMIIIRVFIGRRPDFVPLTVMRGVGIAYVIFYIIDAA